MGACVSKPKGCVGMKNKLKKPIRRRGKKSHNKLNRVEPSKNSADLAYNNPSFQGNGEPWFDLDSVLDSEDEFYSVQDDVSQAGSISTGVTPRFSNTAYCNTTEFQPISDEPQNEVRDSAHLEKASVQCRDESAGNDDDTGISHNCGLLSNTLLPCLACAESLDQKRKLQSPRSPSSRKKLSLTTSFKRRDGQPNTILPSPNTIVGRPIAGSQVTCSPLEKKMSESWSQIESNIFKVRGRNFLRDKKKDFAPNLAAFEPFGVDVFLSPHKIPHIARFVELPAIDAYGEVPPILVVNLQIPLYSATIFQNEYDGEGMNFVFYFKLSENYSKALPLHFRENIRRIIDNEIEKIKGFPLDTNAPFRERLKILTRVVNVEDLQLSSAERKLMNAYNEKPVLSRPQHEFYLGGNYFEIDLDIHRFSYIARKGFEAFQDRIKHCVFDFGLTIQGNKAEDLPEHMMCCLRLKEINYSKYWQLSS
ncbi:unnamed protein product [Fraxinus pennsylvanica]|uniref:Protein ENHANCED DISEASE RESISTANCE 2 C-terminal domain-containing protein n=1 Tax=Fraxinus pennsylvanica TaxID=56036 RepID=A0AAD1YM75_9LAMI|nr:unnamed protein product [Fraxinus pennsylvanica]